MVKAIKNNGQMITISTHALHHHKMSFLPPHLQHLQHLQGDDLKAAIQQEDYTEETATERLAELKDPVKVVQAYLGLGRDACDKPNAIKSKNQLKYGEIRKFMDTGAKQYNAQKELNELRKKYQEHLEQQQQEKLPVFQQEKQEQPNCSNCSPAFATCDGEYQGADHTLHEA